ncbi:hypothetical protein MPER_16360, partial [Moniliophthora perniciosa FA553]
SNNINIGMKRPHPIEEEKEDGVHVAKRQRIIGCDDEQAKRQRIIGCEDEQAKRQRSIGCEDEQAKRQRTIGCEDEEQADYNLCLPFWNSVGEAHSVDEQHDSEHDSGEV